MHARVATTRDIPALVRLINIAYRVEAFFIQGERTSAEEVRGLMDLAGAAFLVFDGAAPEGLAGSVYVEVRGNRGHFGLLAVEPAMQGRGLGRALIAAAEEYCRAARCTALDLEVFDVRSELPPFYRACGFHPVGTIAFSHPELLLKPAHLIQMSKAIDQGV